MHTAPVSPILTPIGDKKLGLHKRIEATSLQLMGAMKEAVEVLVCLGEVGECGVCKKHYC